MEYPCEFHEANEMVLKRDFEGALLKYKSLEKFLVENFGEEHKLVASVKEHIGLTLSQLFRFAESIRSLEEACRINEVLGDEVVLGGV